MRQLDPRLNAYRADLADMRLRDKITAARYIDGPSGRVVAGIAPVRRNPDASSEIATFYHYGEELLLFDQDGGFAWCQSQFDDYVGYVECAAIVMGAVPAPTHFVATMGAYRYPEPDLRSPPLDFLPRHSPVAVVEPGTTTRDTKYARLDTGGYLPLSCLSQQPPSSPDLAAAAARYLGCPYLWGGKSFLGIDCSGLVQSAFRDLGRSVARDTDMQAETIGERVPVTIADELRRDDLLYLPGHVMICEGHGAVIHADGATMMVRRDDLRALMRERRLSFDRFVVRRS